MTSRLAWVNLGVHGGKFVTKKVKQKEYSDDFDVDPEHGEVRKPKRTGKIKNLCLFVLKGKRVKMNILQKLCTIITRYLSSYRGLA